MAKAHVDILESSYQKTQLWLKAIEQKLHGADRVQAYSALRAVLHAIRDCLPAGEAHKLAAQMPLVVRGVYFDGFRPRKPRRLTREDFYEHIRASLRHQTAVDPALATHAVIGVLYENLSPGELRAVEQVLPREIRELWREVEDATLAGAPAPRPRERRPAFARSRGAPAAAGAGLSPPAMPGL